MKSTKIIHILTLLFICTSTYYSYSLPPINLLRPSDRFLIPPVPPCTRFQFTVTYEYPLEICAFQDDEDCGHVRSYRQEGPVNVLQIYQKKQNLMAAFKGQLTDGFQSKYTKQYLTQDDIYKLRNLVQLFNLDDDTGAVGRFIASGSLKIPVNAMFSARWYFDYGLAVGLHIPYYEMKLCNVEWKPEKGHQTLEGIFEPEIIYEAARLGGLNLRGWKRSGFGDLLAQVTWDLAFPQIKPLLKYVYTQARLGVSVPTGKRQDEDKTLAIPFGNDGSWGVQIAGGLDALFKDHIKAGLDAEFLYLFGNTKKRRIRTDFFQTDLLLFTKRCTCNDPGVYQQYNLYVQWLNIVPGASFKLNYQYLKHNDDKIFIKSDVVDSVAIANEAQSLRSWTTHSFMFNVAYDTAYNYPNACFRPYISLWYKKGFKGKNALLADTIGTQISLRF